MGTMADRILAMKPVRSGDISIAQNLLKIPLENHAPCKLAAVGKVDRFVLTDGFVDAFDHEVDDLASKQSLWVSSRPLMPQYWLEFSVSQTAQRGYLVDNDWVRCFTFDRDFDGNVHSVCGFSFEQAAGHMHPFGDSSVWIDRPIDLEISPFFRSLIARGYLQIDELLQQTRLVPIVAMIANCRTAVGRRIIPSQSNAAERSMLRRRFQRGRPIFSYNQVDLILPKTCIYRDEVRSVESFDGVRGHMVIGHWRLIDGVLQPYWIWIDGHERGDRQRGWIVKERIVQFQAGQQRRGFLIPRDPGGPKERRLATRMEASQ
jgi:hypothetical protein